MVSFSWRKMGFNWIIVSILLFHLSISLAETSLEDAAALRSLSSLWTNKPLNWVGSDPCGMQWTGIRCRGNRVISIGLSSIGLEGTLSGDIATLTELQSLDLSYNKGLTGNLPSAIGTLINLTDLILIGCSFSGIIPDLGSLQKLVFLSLNSNRLSGGIPPSIGNLSNLYWLDLADNQLTGPLPVSSASSPGLDLLTGTKHFHLGKNGFSGPLPSKLFNSDMKLIHLILDSNNLSGSIPPTLGLMKHLEVVRLDRNSFTGPLPSNLNNLTKVGEMHLSNNKFTGPLPNLTGMNALAFVDLSNNTFDQSDVPPWFSTLGSLTTLWMEYLRVEGQLPTSLFSIPQLQTVRLRNNLFNGTLDLGSSFSAQLQLVDLEKNRIERYVEGGGYKNELRLVGNPFCDESPSDTRCALVVKSTLPYATPIPDCQSLVCSVDQRKSPNCRCAYPYTGTLYFRAVSFSDVENATKFKALETKLLQSFQTQAIQVDSVALSNTYTNEDNYLQTVLQVFPVEKSRFSQAEISALGFILSNQTFKPPSFFGPFFFIGESYTAAQETSTDAGSSSGSSSKSSLPAIIGAAAGGTVFALIVILLVVCLVKKKKKKTGKNREQTQPFATWDPTGQSGSVPHITGPRPFTIDELRKSTNDFSNANLIGSGGYGKVYKGILPAGQLVAIKRAQKGSMQGGLEFKTEIELLSMVHHKNLVKLVGFCFDREEQMLVYEYIPNGSLKESLSGKSGVALDWKRRLRVAVGAARGLSYLHDHVNPPVVHRDIKSNNILLDENLNAKVADFGLSKPMGEDQKGYVTTQVKGTMGYLDPEYYMTQQLTEKSDVYSFGVLMLELVTAKKPIEKGRYIVREVKVTMDKTRDLYGLDELLDPKLGLATSLKGFERYIQLAMRCVEDAGVDRPSMSEVVKEIEHIMLLAGMNPAVDSAPTSENYTGASREGLHHPYGSDSFDYSGGIVHSNVEPK